MVGFFPNERAIQRLGDLMLHQQDDEYAIQKRYMRLESIAQLNRNPTTDFLLRRHWPDVRGDPS
jgi:putative transposase